MKYLLFTSLLTICFSVFADSIFISRSELINLNDKISDQQNTIDSISNYVAGNYQLSERFFNEAENMDDRFFNWVNVIFIIIGALITGVALFGTIQYRRTLRKLEKEANAGISEKINQLIGENSTLLNGAVSKLNLENANVLERQTNLLIENNKISIRRIIEEEEELTKTKRESKILVVCPDKSKIPPSFKKIIMRFGEENNNPTKKFDEQFVEIPILTRSNLNDKIKDVAQFDAILFYNNIDSGWLENNLFEPTAQKEFIDWINEDPPTTPILHFGVTVDVRGIDPNTEQRYWFSFANAYSQLYGNLMNLLITHKLLKYSEN